MNLKKQLFIISILSTLPILTMVKSASANLIGNGDFEAGNTGFFSDYSFTPGNIVPPGTFDIVTDPSTSHPSATSYGDNTSGTGNMMAVNGSTVPRETVWGEIVSVSPNSTYDFAAYISSWISSSPAQLSFLVNDRVIGSLSAPSSTADWDLFFATWSSGENTTANIEIVNNNTVFSGNDFALDDIYFGEPIFSEQPVSSSVPEPNTPAFFMFTLAFFILNAGQKLKVEH